MSVADMVAYVGMVSGIAGAVMGYISLRRTSAIKALDLRLELRKAVNAIEFDLSRLPELMDKAHRSRQAVAAATGRARSGVVKLWDNELGEDKSRLGSLTERAPSSTQIYNDLTPAELEDELVAAHKLQGEIDGLKNKYKAALSSDDEERKRLQEDRRAQTHTLIQRDT